MEYPVVKDAHIVPRCLLAAFSEDEKVDLRVDHELVPGPVSIEDAAVRHTYYRRTRPDGTAIDDGEWSLNKIESAAAPLLANLSEIWDSLKIESKGTLAEFFAVQAVRGPRWKSWWLGQTKAAVDKWRREPEPLLHNGLWIPMTHRTINEFEDQALENTAWLTRMFSISKKIAEVFGSMRWTLVEFEEPFLAMSDHPVVEWPLDVDYRQPEPNREGVGALNLLEVRVPVSPSQAILMTWSDEVGLTARVRASREVGSNVNAFTVANSERQWYSKPGRSTPLATGFLEPIAPFIFDGYCRESVEESKVRRTVSENIQPKLGDDQIDELDLFTVGPVEL